MSKCISSICVENIKGLENWKHRFDGLVPNKINLMVASNGFGKSSIATAFDVSSHGKIKIDRKYLYNMDERKKPSFKIEYYDDDGSCHNICCDEENGDISKKFYVQTIDSPIYAKSTGRSMGVYSVYTAAMKIRDIEICDVPPKKVIDYKIKNVKSELGKNMPNLCTWFSSEIGLEFLINNKAQIERCLNLKRTSSLIEAFIANKNETGLKDNKDIEILLSALKDMAITNNTDEAITYLLEIFYVVKTNSYNLIKQAYEWMRYQNILNSINDRLQEFNTTGLKLQAKKSGKKLLVQFGDATRMSNGERDVLSFIVSLTVFENTLKKNRPGILVIDEVFDYLDGTNMLAAQYYLSRMIENIKAKGKESYIILMTHLDPAVFGNYYFKKMAFHYLSATSQIDLNDSLVKLLILRSSLKTKNIEAAQCIEKYFLHYHNDNKSLPEEIQNENSFLEWSDRLEFRKYLYEEVEKYIGDHKDYNALAVVIGLRHKIEEKIVGMLTPEAVEEFIEERGSKNKLQLAEEYACELPELFYLLQPLYNDSAHLREKADKENMNKIKSAYLKTQSQIVKKMIEKVFRDE